MTNTSKKVYYQWDIIPPPATRIFQKADGSMNLYFEAERAAEMVEWARAQVAYFEMRAMQSGVKVDEQGVRHHFTPTEDEGVKIAMRQAGMIDAAKGINREEKNKAPDDESTTAQTEPAPPVDEAAFNRAVEEAKQSEKEFIE